MSASFDPMILAIPYPAELLRVARKVVWYAKPEQTLADLKTFLSHLMVYGGHQDQETDGQMGKGLRARGRHPFAAAKAQQPEGCIEGQHAHQRHQRQSRRAALQEFVEGE